jgi:hypothetical protein
VLTRYRMFVALLALAAAACAGDELLHRYPPGAPPPAGSANATVSHSGTIAELPARVQSAAERSSVPDGALERAARFTAYSVTVEVGGGYGKSVQRYCDYVIADSNDLVLGAYRVRGGC